MTKKELEVSGGTLQVSDAQLAVLGLDAPGLTDRAIDFIRNRKELLRHIIDEVFTEGAHYGQIPGLPKKILLQPGAEELGLIFRCRAEFAVLRQEVTPEYVQYDVKCSLYMRGGELAGQGPIKMGDGLGTSNSAEKRVQRMMRAQGLRDARSLAENILQMARKRAFVQAVRTMLGISEFFTQDEELIEAEDTEDEEPASRIKRKSNGTAKENDEATLRTQRLRVLHAVAKKRLEDLGGDFTDEQVHKLLHRVAVKKCGVHSLKQCTAEQLARLIEFIQQPGGLRGIYPPERPKDEPAAADASTAAEETEIVYDPEMEE